MRIAVGHLVDASGDEFLVGDFFALIEVLDDGGQDEGGHGSPVRGHHVIAQDSEEVAVTVVFD